MSADRRLLIVLLCAPLIGFIGVAARMPFPMHGSPTTSSMPRAPASSPIRPIRGRRRSARRRPSTRSARRSRWVSPTCPARTLSPALCWARRTPVVSSSALRWTSTQRTGTAIRLLLPSLLARVQHPHPTGARARRGCRHALALSRSLPLLSAECWRRCGGRSVYRPAVLLLAPTPLTTDDGRPCRRRRRSGRAAPGSPAGCRSSW